MGTASTTNILTMAEIEARYAGEWVLLADPQTDRDLNVRRGRLLCHSANRDEVDQFALEAMPRSSALLFIGRPDKAAVFVL